MSQTTLPEPQTRTLRAFESSSPFHITTEAVIPSDEVNPDTLTSAIGMAIGALEGAAEAEGMAADWESIRITRYSYPKQGYLLVQVSVDRLAS